MRSMRIALASFLFVLFFTFDRAMAAPASAPLQGKEETRAGSDASQTPLMRAITHTDTRAFKSLLDSADLNAQDDGGWTALMVAARLAQTNFVKALLRKGADVNAQSKSGLTALILAARSLTNETDADVEIAKMLIGHGANVNAKGKDGITALMSAAQQGRLKLVKLLLEKGAKVNDEDNEHATAWTYALSGKHQEVIDCLRSAGATGPEPHREVMTPDIVDQRPVPLNNPAPRYTEEARKHGVEGMILARVLVGPDGQVQQVRIVRGLPDGLDEQAIRAAFQLKFKPAVKGGKPVAFWQAVSIEFHLRKRSGASI